MKIYSQTFSKKIKIKIFVIILQMLKKKLLLISFITVLFIAIFHYLALKYSWYWTFRGLDIPVHIVGGFWVSLTALWVALKIGHIEKITDYKKRALLIMLSSVLIVGILWEIFEVVFKITFLHDIGYFADSLKDILNGLIGGIISYLYFMQSKSAKNCVLKEPDSSLSMIIKH
jgi:hypothetical protein